MVSSGKDWMRQAGSKSQRYNHNFYAGLADPKPSDSDILKLVMGPNLHYNLGVKKSKYGFLLLQTNIFI